MEGAGITVHVVPIIKISSKTFSLGGLLKLPFQAIGSMRAMSRMLHGTKVDMVHSNTLAVFSGALWAWKNKVFHIWHIHEIIVHPAFAKRLFPWIVKKFADIVVCNSNATRKRLLESEPSLATKSVVIWNGVERDTAFNESDVCRFRRELGIEKGVVLVVHAGRINRMKGQVLLVQAATILWDRGVRNVRFLIVGSALTGQEYFTKSLKERISAFSKRGIITLMDFREDIWTIWDACDIAVVPSTEPESFGMVAVEAMVAGKPVVAARHGGLTDIVEHGVTGFLFEPGDVGYLAASLEELATSRKKRETFGQNGLTRVREKFTMLQYISSFNAIYETGGNQ